MRSPRRFAGWQAKNARLPLERCSISPVGEPPIEVRGSRERAMTVSLSRLENIAVVTIDRPQQRNAVDYATARELANAFRGFDSDSALAVAILTGAGGHFCAGADLKAFANGERRAVGIEGDGPMGPTRMRLSKPVIA